MFSHLNQIEKHVIQTRTLDDVYDELKRQFGFRRPCLKLDTQAHDVAIVRGTRQTVRLLAEPPQTLPGYPRD
jgi:hypothetical protein